MDLAVVGVGAAAHHHGVVRRAGRRLEDPGDDASCRARRRPARPRSRTGRRAARRTAPRSEPGSPKSRAKASGKTTRSAPSGTADASRSRFCAGSSDDASCTSTTCMAPACHRPATATAARLAGWSGRRWSCRAARRRGSAGPTRRPSSTPAAPCSSTPSTRSPAPSEVVVVGPAVADVPPGDLRPRDRRRVAGPLAGLAAGVAALAGSHDRWSWCWRSTCLTSPPTPSPGCWRRPRTWTPPGWPTRTGRRQLAGVVRPCARPAARATRTALPMRRLMDRAAPSATWPRSGREADDVDTWADVRGCPATDTVPRHEAGSDLKDSPAFARLGP